MTDQIATESKALHGELGAQETNTDVREGEEKNSDKRVPKSLTVKSRKCKHIFPLEI